MQECDRPGETKADSKGGTKEAEEGESVKANREDVVQAALTVERWCDIHMDEFGNCDCPFKIDFGKRFGLCAVGHDRPSEWSLETFLRTRGLKDDD